MNVLRRLILELTLYKFELSHNAAEETKISAVRKVKVRSSKYSNQMGQEISLGLQCQEV